MVSEMTLGNMEEHPFYETGVYPSAKAMVLPLSPLRDPVSLLFC